MKKFKTMALMMCLAAFAMVFASCQKDEDLIVGKWKLVSVSGGSTSTSDDNGIGATYEFKEDKTLTMSYQGFSIDAATWSISDDYLYITMTVGGVSDTQKSKIDTLKKKKMVLIDESDNSKAEFEKI